MQEQISYNNELHANQTKFKGKTRLEVFLENVNPDLPKFDKGHLVKYIGDRRETSIRRSQYVTVQYEKYQLSSPEVLRKLAPNNYNVDAYYLPNAENEIKEVFIYQNGQFISECKPVPTFNRANSEWTDADKEGYTEATKYISQFDAMVKKDTAETLQKVSIIRTNKNYIDVTPEVIPQIESEQEEEFEYEYVDVQLERNRAINDL